MRKNHQMGRDVPEPDIFGFTSFILLKVPRGPYAHFWNLKVFNTVEE